MRTQKSRIVNLVIALFLIIFLWARVAEAQPIKIPRIGFLIASSASAQEPRLEAFRQGLRECGYVEGQNIVIELRSGEGKPDRLPVATAELLHLKVDVIVTGGPQSTRVAKKATNTIPIVMTLDSDPVGQRLVASLARPGGNVTGLSTLSPELSGKRLELLKEIVPRLTRVAILSLPTDPQYAVQLKEIDDAARALGVQLQNLELRGPKDIGPAFRGAAKGRADAVLAQAPSVLLSQRTQVAELAVKNRLPVMYSREEFVEAGGLVV